MAVMKRALAGLVLFVAALPLRGQVALSWQDNSSDEAGFRIYRAIGASGAFLPWDQVGPNVTTYVDTQVQPATVYRYRGTSFKASGESVASNIATVTTPGVPSGAPAALSGMTATIPPQPSELVNVSIRGNITATDSTIIAGFVVGPGTGAKVLVRVVGPTLGAAPFNVPGVCADPRLEVRDALGAVMGSNNDWSGAEVSNAAIATGAFALPVGSKDAAVVVTLPPGNYTVVCSGVGGATGIGLAEVFKLP